MAKFKVTYEYEFIGIETVEADNEDEARDIFSKTHGYCGCPQNMNAKYENERRLVERLPDDWPTPPRKKGK